MDLSNTNLRYKQLSHPYKLDNRLEPVVIEEVQPLLSNLAELILNSYLKHRNIKPTSYTNVFSDDFWGLFQGPVHRRHHVWSTLFYKLYKVLHPLYSHDTSN